VTLRITATTLVLDLEGTTSAAGFILGDLYDYARPRLGDWLDDHAADPAIAAARQQVVADAGLPADASTEQIVAVLVQWMADDVKATPLKTIQGQIWAEGFARGEISSHFFDDVIPRLRACTPPACSWPCSPPVLWPARCRGSATPPTAT
jgi:enolase-phosphatase E1